MDKEKQIRAIELLNKIEESKLNYGDLSDEEKTLFSDAHLFVETKGVDNEEFNSIVRSPLENRKKYVEDYYASLKKDDNEEEIQAIKETFGFDITDIENKKLDNGVEIFKFYAPKLQRIVVLQNRQDLSLVEQLKQKQALNEQFQTNNDKENTNSMLEEERQKDNVELKMIYPSEINNYGETISNMSEEDRAKLFYLINNAEVLGIKKINIQNLIYLDQNDKIREVVYDKEEEKIEDQNPNTLNNNEERIDTSSRIDESLSKDEQMEALSNDYEDNPEEIKDYEQLTPEVQEQVKNYVNYPELLDNMTEEERKKWEHYIELYKQNEEKLNSIEKPKVYSHKKKENGDVNIIFMLIISSLTILGMILAIYYYNW